MKPSPKNRQRKSAFYLYQWSMFPNIWSINFEKEVVKEGYVTPQCTNNFRQHYYPYVILIYIPRPLYDRRMKSTTFNSLFYVSPERCQLYKLCRDNWYCGETLFRILYLREISSEISTSNGVTEIGAVKSVSWNVIEFATSRRALNFFQ